MVVSLAVLIVADSASSSASIVIGSVCHPIYAAAALCPRRPRDKLTSQ